MHPNFRLVAIGEPKKSAGHAGGVSPLHSPWISPELLSMFQFHPVTPLPVDQEREVILGKVCMSSDPSRNFGVYNVIHMVQKPVKPCQPSISSGCKGL